MLLYFMYAERPLEQKIAVLLFDSYFSVSYCNATLLENRSPYGYIIFRKLSTHF